MKRIALILCLAALPAAAQPTVPPPAAAPDEGFSLMEEGAKLLFRGLMREMEPALDGMGAAVADLEPALKQLLAMVDDIRNYEAPERLDNGDILIRRKPGTGVGPRAAPEGGPTRAPEPGPNGEIDL